MDAPAKQEVVLPLLFVILMAIGALTIAYYLFQLVKCLGEFAAGGVSVRFVLLRVCMRSHMMCLA